MKVYVYVECVCIIDNFFIGDSIDRVFNSEDFII